MKIKRRIDEKDLLKMLDIPSFRHMTKDKLASFVSALPDVDPDVAKKALEQFPDFSTAMAEIVSHYRGIVSECLAGSDGDTRLCLETCASMVNSIQRELDKKELSFEQQQALIDRSMELVQTMKEISADGKHFRAHVINVTSIALVVVTGALISAIGGKVDFSLSDLIRPASRA